MPVLQGSCSFVDGKAARFYRFWLNSQAMFVASLSDPNPDVLE